MPFGELAERRGFARLLEEIEVFYDPYGWFPVREKLAVDMLRLFPARCLGALFGLPFQSVGILRGSTYAELMEAASRPLDVRFHEEAVAVERGGATPLRVRTRTGGSFESDFVYVTTPPDCAPAVWPDSAHARAPLGRFLFNSYSSAIVEADGLFPGVLHLPENRARRGRALLFFRAGPSLWTTFAMGERFEDLAGDVASAGGKLKHVHHVRHWPRYFPHAVEPGVVDAVEALQGRDGIFYAGDWLAGHGVANVTQHAVSLVHRVFSGRNR